MSSTPKNIQRNSSVWMLSEHSHNKRRSSSGWEELKVELLLYMEKNQLKYFRHLIRKTFCLTPLGKRRDFEQVLLREDPRTNPELTDRIMFLHWPGDILGFHRWDLSLVRNLYFSPWLCTSFTWPLINERKWLKWWKTRV